MATNLSQVKSWWLVLVFYVVAVGLFFKGLFNFYTHDDFFHYKIAEANSIQEFLGFFDLTSAPYGWGYYRPLTTQVVYFIGREVFQFNPIAMHALAFGLFFIVLTLAYQLLKKLIDDQLAILLATFFYAVSASHFPHFYSIANQELGHAIFFLSSLLLLIKFWEKGGWGWYGLSLISFVGALVSKEFAVMLPVAIVLVYGLLRLTLKIKASIKQFILQMVPFGIIGGLYGYLHVFEYGLVRGDSYIWVFSPLTGLNSLVWYLLWSLNVPKMLPDFIGPGLRINPNLWRFWSIEVVPIFVLFGVFILLFILTSLLSIKETKKADLWRYLFAILWFSTLLAPVVFLPWHKFWEYLTLPLVGVVLVLGLVISRARKFLLTKKQPIGAGFLVAVLAAIFGLQSYLTIQLSEKTEWTATGAQVARRVYDYFEKHYSEIKEPMAVVFYDTQDDGELPWLPSQQVKLALSDNNFFAVFYDGQIEAKYVESLGEAESPEAIKLPARQFLGY